MSSEVSAADEMGQAVANLVTEMSATTFDDVVSKWDAVCAEWQEQVAQLEDEVAHLQKELLVYDVAVKDEARVIKKLGADVERLREALNDTRAECRAALRESCDENRLNTIKESAWLACPAESDVAHYREALEEASSFAKWCWNQAKRLTALNRGSPAFDRLRDEGRRVYRLTRAALDEEEA